MQTQRWLIPVAGLSNFLAACLPATATVDRGFASQPIQVEDVGELVAIGATSTGLPIRVSFAKHDNHYVVDGFRGGRARRLAWRFAGQFATEPTEEFLRETPPVVATCSSCS